MNKAKYAGVIPAFYACYDDAGRVSEAAVRSLARHLVNRGVKGLYVGGSSGECIYLEKEERMRTLEAVMAEIKGECTVIAHVACNNTEESCQLAAHAEALGLRPQKRAVHPEGPAGGGVQSGQAAPLLDHAPQKGHRPAWELPQHPHRLPHKPAHHHAEPRKRAGLCDL